MENIYADYRRKKDGTHYDIGPITFYRDIWPLIQRPCLLSWVNGQANGGHGKLALLTMTQFLYISPLE
jgi:hypothetical protein